MEADAVPLYTAAFAAVQLEDLASGEPLKQIPALHKLLFEQCNGKECSHYLDVLYKVR